VSSLEEEIRRTRAQRSARPDEEYLRDRLRVIAAERRVVLPFIQPGKPTHNACRESFNGRLRNEYLDSHGFGSIREARVRI
jgi:putative transposase